MSRDLTIACRVFVPSVTVGCVAVAVGGAAAAPYVVVLLLALLLAVCVGLAQHIRREIDARYRRVEALLAIYGVVTPAKPLPAPREYMASPELLRAVTAAIFEVQPQLVVELGSGVSTLVAAYALAKLGGGRMISLDHEAKYAEQTNALLRAHGLEHVAVAVHAPLVDVQTGTHRGRWYDLTALNQHGAGDIDLLIVDGPPGRDQPLARYPALPMLRARLSSRACVIVDDARRPDETAMVQRWATQFPDFAIEALPTEKGTTLLRRAAPAPAVPAPQRSLTPADAQLRA